MEAPGERVVTTVAEDGTIGLACAVQDDGSVLIRRARSDGIEPGNKEPGA